MTRTAERGEEHHSNSWEQEKEKFVTKAWFAIDTRREKERSVEEGKESRVLILHADPDERLREVAEEKEYTLVSKKRGEKRAE